ncbi:MAG TPA: hypothetical protein VI757_10395 [Bacteroidia bacterium]|nr:hypothetical protein [Bacteroidia bacterium]
MERFLNDDDYNPSVFYLYEVCEGNDVDLIELIKYVLSKREK